MWRYPGQDSIFHSSNDERLSADERRREPAQTWLVKLEREILSGYIHSSFAISWCWNSNVTKFKSLFVFFACTVCGKDIFTTATHETMSSVCTVLVSHRVLTCHQLGFISLIGFYEVCAKRRTMGRESWEKSELDHRVFTHWTLSTCSRAESLLGGDGAFYGFIHICCFKIVLQHK